MKVKRIICVIAASFLMVNCMAISAGAVSKEEHQNMSLVIAGLSCFLYVYNPSGNVWPFNDLFAPDQYWMILSLPFVLVLSDKKEKKEKQMLGHLDYFFYPAHMCLFNVLSTLFS